MRRPSAQDDGAAAPTPAGGAHEIFVSYAREDLPFARRLKSALEAQGRTVWVDVDGAYAGEAFWPQIIDAIDQARIVLFVVTEHSVGSAFCRQELEHATRRHKRIVPVLRAPVDERALPAAVAARQWVFFRDEDPFDAALADLLAGIDADLPWLQAHTRLLTQAIAWDGHAQDPSELLRGSALREAERLLSQSAGKDPEPSALQSRFVLESRRHATKRQRIVLGAVSLALVVSVVFGLVAFHQYRLAEDRARVALGRLLVSQAANRLDGQLDLALLLSLLAHRVHPSDATQGGVLAALQHNPRLESFLRGHDAGIQALAYSADGRWLASGDRDGSVVVWDLSTQAPRGPPLRGHQAGIVALGFRADGSRLVSVDSQGRIVTWDPAAGTPQAQAQADHGEALTTATFSHDGAMLAMAGRYRLTLWDVAAQARRGRTVHGPLAIVTGLAFSPDGSRLLTADGRTGLIEWDVATQQPVGAPVQSGQDVLAVAVSPEGSQMASATRWVTFWDRPQRRPLGEPLRGHESNMTALRYSPDGSLLASANSDNTVRLWDARQRTLVDVLRPAVDPGQQAGATATLAFSPDGGQLATAGADGIVHLWRVVPGSALQQVLAGHEDRVHGVAFSPDGRLLASGGQEGTVRLWDARTGRPAGPPLRGHGDGGVVALAFSPDGRRLLSGSIGWTSTLRLWDLDSRTAIGPPRADHQVPGHPFGVFVAAFDRRGTRLATGGWDGMVRRWRVDQLEPAGAALDGEGGSVIALAFNGDGSRLASGDGRGKVSLWDMASGRLTQRRAHGDGRDVIALAFAADDDRLISVHGDGSIVVARLGPGDEAARTAPAAGLKLRAAAISDDRQRLASLDARGAIHLWNLDTLQRLEPPLLPASATRFLGAPAWAALAFSPDAKTLAAAVAGREILLWDVDPASWRERACARANRDLTRAEWDEHVGAAMPYEPVCRPREGPERLRGTG